MRASGMMGVAVSLRMLAYHPLAGAVAIELVLEDRYVALNAIHNPGQGQEACLAVYTRGRDYHRNIADLQRAQAVADGHMV